MPKIYTKTGDRGETGLITGGRVPKDAPILEAYGTVDELNSFIGMARSAKPSKSLDQKLHRIQVDLFKVGADLACPWEDRESQSDKKYRIERISDSLIRNLEKEIDEAESELQPLKNFILPAGSQVAAFLHASRTVCRRAERRCLATSREGKSNPSINVYLNRLSDWLFVYARLANLQEKIDDVLWIPE